MHRLSLSLLALLLPLLAAAREVPPERAGELAAGILASAPATRGLPAVELVWDGLEAATRSGSAAPFYIFNRTDAPGFVIVAGDDAVEPLLAYSFDHPIRREGMPESLSCWLEGVREQVEAVREAGLTAPESVRQVWEAPRAAEAELEYVTAQWDQEWPYNLLSPRVNGGRAVTGCVPTAMAIYMRYHGWPERGEGTLPAYRYSTGYGTVDIEGHELGHPYDWQAMPLRLDESSTDEQRLQVATLLYDLGVMSQATFNVAYLGGTGAITNMAVAGLTQYMGYAHDARLLYRMWYSDEEWVAMLREEMRTNGPILYGGFNAARQGHEFILDGYASEDFFRVNWGWSGSGNGYFRISALNPSYAGAGGMTGSGYNTRQNAAFGLLPARGEASYVDRLCVSSGQREGIEGFTARTARFETGEEFLCDVRYLFNMGLSEFAGIFQVVLCDREGNLRESVSRDIQVAAITPGYGREYTAISCRITQPLRFGDTLRLRARGARSGEWHWVLGDEGATWQIAVRPLPSGRGALEKGTRLLFDRRTRELTLQTLPGAGCSLTGPDGEELLREAPDAEGMLRIATGQFGSGAHTLRLSCDGEQKSLTITFSE